MGNRISVMLACAMIISSGALYSPVRAIGHEENTYVGSKNCGMCHPDEKKSWDTHSHGKMLRSVRNGLPPEGVDVQPPDGTRWSDFSWLVGGNRNYARFIDMKGYVVTGRTAQWSMSGKTLTAFKSGSLPGTLKYNCITCHVVGWKKSGTYDGGVTNELEGIPGVWFENGVGCEACHGMGANHMSLKNKAEAAKAGGDLDISTDKSPEACGTCHKRPVDKSLSVVAKDLVESRQQYTEMSLNKKGKFKFTCVMCHDPHASVASVGGLVKKCEDCHTGKFAKPVKIAAMANAGVTCIDCHMPYADRGAFDTMMLEYHRGDTRSHIFGISTDPSYTLDDGSGRASLTGDGFVRLTVEMTCYSCHKAGKSTAKTREQLLEMTKKIHGS